MSKIYGMRGGLVNMLITEKQEDDIHYVCSLLEYIARVTDNYVGDIAEIMTLPELAWQLKFAHVSNSMTFEQVAERVIKHLNIRRGNYRHRNDRPSHVDMGDIFKTMVIIYMTKKNVSAEKAIKKVLMSGLSDYLTEYSFSKME